MPRIGNYIGTVNLDTENELLTLQSMRSWTLTGPNAVVKVVGIDDIESLPSIERDGTVRGYVTQARYINGLNANQIERDLGLRQASVKCGLWVYWLARLPTLDEVEQRFRTNWPDGRPWTKRDFAKYWAARDAVPDSPTERIDIYVPGSKKVPQWKVLRPVGVSGARRQVTASVPFSL